MDEYISLLKGKSSTSKDQSQLAFDLSAPKNQQLMDDLKKVKAVIVIVYN